MTITSPPPAFEGGRQFRWNSERKHELLSGLAGLRSYGSTGIRRLDELLGGGLSCGVHLLSALPGAGKSTLALQIADHVARFGLCGAVYVSLEMGGSALVAKSVSRLSAEMGSPLSFAEIVRLVSRAADRDTPKFDSLSRAVDVYFSEVGPRIATIDAPLSVAALSALYDSIPADEAKPVCVVDYLQIMPREERDAAMSDVQSVTATMRELCCLAQKHSVPVIAVSSQNRGAKRGGVSLDLLAGSSALEFGAVTVSFLCIDGDSDEERARNAELTARPVTLNLAKNRYGRLGRVPLWFCPGESRFVEREG